MKRTLRTFPLFYLWMSTLVGVASATTSLEAVEVTAAVSDSGDNKEPPTAKAATPTERFIKVLPLSREPARVRIGFRMAVYEPVVVRNRTGASSTRYLRRNPIQHTLRARVEQINHFYVGEWHIETIPQKVVNQTRRYEVRLNFYRRFGDAGDVEEKVGSLDLGGFLEEQDKQSRLFVLQAYRETQFRDPLGNPIADVVAGYRPNPDPPAMLSKGETSSASGKASSPPAAEPAKEANSLEDAVKERTRF